MGDEDIEIAKYDTLEIYTHIFSSYVYLWERESLTRLFAIKRIMLLESYVGLIKLCHAIKILDLIL